MRSMGMALLVIASVFMAGCNGQRSFGKLDNTPYATQKCRNSLSRGSEVKRALTIDRIVVYKKKRKLTTYKKGKKMGTFRISLGKNGNRGDKVQQGDYRTPEGKYRIIRKKCDSRLYRSLLISYPNSSDRSRARKRGVNPGGYITIHGQPKWNANGIGDSYTLAHDWTEGCIAVTNTAMNTLWYSVRKGVIVEIYP